MDNVVLLINSRLTRLMRHLKTDCFLISNWFVLVATLMMTMTIVHWHLISLIYGHLISLIYGHLISLIYDVVWWRDSAGTWTCHIINMKMEKEKKSFFFGCLGSMVASSLLDTRHFKLLKFVIHLPWKINCVVVSEYVWLRRRIEVVFFALKGLTVSKPALSNTCE